MERDQDTMTTYRRADGELIGGEYAFVADAEWFFDSDDDVELVKEVWQLVTRETVALGGPGLCPACQGEGGDWHTLTVMGEVLVVDHWWWTVPAQLAVTYVALCAHCGGTGEEPDRGS